MELSAQSPLRLAVHFANMDRNVSQNKGNAVEHGGKSVTGTALYMYRA